MRTHGQPEQRKHTPRAARADPHADEADAQVLALLGAIAFVGLALALAVALHTKRVFRSETTVLYREGLPTRRARARARPAAPRASGPS